MQKYTSSTIYFFSKYKGGFLSGKWKKNPIIVLFMLCIPAMDEYFNWNQRSYKEEIKSYSQVLLKHTSIRIHMGKYGSLISGGLICKQWWCQGNGKFQTVRVPWLWCSQGSYVDVLAFVQLRNLMVILTRIYTLIFNNKKLLLIKLPDIKLKTYIRMNFDLLSVEIGLFFRNAADTVNQSV